MPCWNFYVSLCQPITVVTWVIAVSLTTSWVLWVSLWCYEYKPGCGLGRAKWISKAQGWCESTTKVISCNTGRSRAFPIHNSLFCYVYAQFTAYSSIPCFTVDHVIAVLKWWVITCYMPCWNFYVRLCQPITVVTWVIAVCNVQLGLETWNHFIHYIVWHSIFSVCPHVVCWVIPSRVQIHVTAVMEMCY